MNFKKIVVFLGISGLLIKYILKNEDTQDTQSTEDIEEYQCTTSNCSRTFDSKHGRAVHEGKMH